MRYYKILEVLDNGNLRSPVVPVFHLKTIYDTKEATYSPNGFGLFVYSLKKKALYELKGFYWLNAKLQLWEVEVEKILPKKLIHDGWSFHLQQSPTTKVEDGVELVEGVTLKKRIK